MDKLRTFMMAVEKTNLFVGKMMAYVSLVCVVGDLLRGDHALRLRHADELGT